MIIEPNDLMLAQRAADSRIVAARACPRSQLTGKINPHVTVFAREDGSRTSVFSGKPVYYETKEGLWRPL